MRSKRRMMRAVRPLSRRVRLPLARTTVAGRQSEYDGSRLLDCYAVNPQEPESKEPTIIYFSPGALELFRMSQIFGAGYPISGVAPHVREGVRGMVSIDSAVYGHVLFGVYGNRFYFVVRVKDAAEHGRGVFSRADWDKLSRGEWRGARFGKRPNEGAGDYSSAAMVGYQTKRFAETADDVLDDDRLAVKLVTDGRRILWTNYKRKVFAFDLEAWDDEQDGRLNDQQKADRTEEPHGKLVTVTTPSPEALSSVPGSEYWVDVEWTSGYFLLASRNQEFFHSVLDSLEFREADYSEAVVKPDPNEGLLMLNRRLLVFGKESIEHWYDAGGSDFSFRRDTSLSVDIGCANVATIRHLDVGAMFLASDGKVYFITHGMSMNVASNDTIEYDIARSDLSKARAIDYVSEGHRFYSLYLAIGEDFKNWVFDVNTQFWHERAWGNLMPRARFGTVDFVDFRVPNNDWTCAVEFLGRTLVGGTRYRSVFDLSLDWGANDWHVFRDGDERSIGQVFTPPHVITTPLVHAENRGFTQFSVDLQVEGGDEVVVQPDVDLGERESNYRLFFGTIPDSLRTPLQASNPTPAQLQAVFDYAGVHEITDYDFYDSNYRQDADLLRRHFNLGFGWDGSGVPSGQDREDTVFITDYRPSFLTGFDYSLSYFANADFTGAESGLRKSGGSSDTLYEIADANGKMWTVYFPAGTPFGSGIRTARSVAWNTGGGGGGGGTGGGGGSGSGSGVVGLRNWYNHYQSVKLIRALTPRVRLLTREASLLRLNADNAPTLDNSGFLDHSAINLAAETDRMRFNRLGRSTNGRNIRIQFENTRQRYRIISAYHEFTISEA